tara:strand:- start:39 stop:353 length:315 start_codon:yes stop_codon:yes gene_type:complete
LPNKDRIQSIYVKIKENHKGKVADYIPQLASVNPDLLAISICSTAGEIFELGGMDREYCLQSCSKPLHYCLARMLHVGVMMYDAPIRSYYILFLLSLCDLIFDL